MDSEGLTRLFDGPWVLSARGFCGKVGGRQGMWRLFVSHCQRLRNFECAQNSEKSHQYHVGSVPSAEEAPQALLHSSCAAVTASDADK